jgi:hypothetical protein
MKEHSSHRVLFNYERNKTMHSNTLDQYRGSQNFETIEFRWENLKEGLKKDPFPQKEFTQAELVEFRTELANNGVECTLEELKVLIEIVQRAQEEVLEE